MTYALMILALNVNNNAFLVIHAGISIYQYIFAAYYLDFIFGHVVWTSFTYQGFTAIFGYINIYKSKMHFITRKKLERMAKEQY